MNISRFLSEDMIDLDFRADQEEAPEDSESTKWRERNKERVLAQLVKLLEKSDRTGNNTKLLNDFIHRERKASTGIGNGIAIPHIRSMQAKEFILGFARSHEGFDFDSLDGKPTRIFFIMAAPPYDDNLYLKVFKALAENLQYESFRQELISAEEPYDIIRAFRNVE
ncbi:MAG: PTS fructose transporter subunit IIA [Candidatus Zixiibacteriota bacterium]|nr:MAG: PTS fructose transporter subunit IIA [candidate division Zixibacteria bacterium]